MILLNSITLIGRLTRDPELRYTPQGVAVANFAIAVDRPFTNAAGEREADFIDCIAWRKLGETVGNHLTKGRLVAVEGRIQIRSYTAQDGSKRKVTEVVADAVRFLDRPKSQEERTEAGVSVGAGAGDHEALQGEDDLPF